MATPRGPLSSALGLPDIREKTKKDLVDMYSDYILSGQPRSVVKGMQVSKPSSEPGWGEISEVADEEEISPDKGQIAEVDEEEETPAPAEEDAIEQDAEEEAVDAAGALPAASAKNPYDDEILKELEAAKAELLKEKRLSIADILGAGNIRKSAQLIRETEKMNEQRQMKAKELALDILMRKSASEEKRQAAESLADYRRRMVEARMLAAQKGPEEVDKQVRSRAKARFPNLSPEAAYQKYVTEVLDRPPAPPRPQSDPIIFRMGLIKAMRDTNKPRPPTQDELNALSMYEEQQKKGSGLAALLEILGAQNK